MSICTSQCLFSHSFTTYEWLNRDCDAQIYIGITSRWTGHIAFKTIIIMKYLQGQQSMPQKQMKTDDFGSNSFLSCNWQNLCGQFRGCCHYLLSFEAVPRPRNPQLAAQRPPRTWLILLDVFGLFWGRQAVNDEVKAPLESSKKKIRVHKRFLVSITAIFIF
jgi:hypothetical protein